MKISFQDAFWTELGRTWAPKVPKMTPTWRQDDPKSTKNRGQQIINILIENKTARTRFLGPPGGMRSPPGGDLGEVQKLRQRRYAVRCRDLLLRSWHLWPLQQLRLGVWHAVLSPLRGGRRIASPKGEHRRPPVPFILPLGSAEFCLRRSLRHLQH